MTHLGRICVWLMIVIQVVYAQSEIETARTICPAMRKLTQPFRWLDASIAAMNKRMSGSKDMLWRILRMHDYNTQFDPSQNFCNTFQFGPDCRGSQCFPKLSAREGSTGGVCYTYNARTQNTVKMELEYEKIDDKFAIQSNRITKIEHIDTRSGHVTNQFVSGIPTNVTVAQDLYTYLAVQPQGYWSIMQSCDERVTWVRVLVPFLNYDEASPMLAEILNLNQMEQEVNMKLQDLGIDSLNLTPVPLVSPFPPQPVGSSFSPQLPGSSFSPQPLFSASPPFQPLQPVTSSFSSQPSITPFPSQYASSAFPPQQGTSPFLLQPVLPPLPFQRAISPLPPSPPPQQGTSPFLFQPVLPPLPFQRAISPPPPSPPQQGTSPFLVQSVLPPLPFQRAISPPPPSPPSQSTNPFNVDPAVRTGNPFLHEPVARRIPSEPTVLRSFRDQGLITSASSSPSMTSPSQPATSSSPPAQSTAAPILRGPVTGTFNPWAINSNVNGQNHPDMIPLQQ